MVSLIESSRVYNIQQYRLHTHCNAKNSLRAKFSKWLSPHWSRNSASCLLIRAVTAGSRDRNNILLRALNEALEPLYCVHCWTWSQLRVTHPPDGTLTLIWRHPVTTPAALSTAAVAGAAAAAVERAIAEFPMNCDYGFLPVWTEIVYVRER